MTYTNIVSSIILISTGILLAFICLNHLRIEISSYFWPSTLADVKSKKYNYKVFNRWPSSIFSDLDPSCYGTAYYLDITYQYVVKGKEYNFDGRMSSEDAETIQKMRVEKEKNPEQIMIYYNPLNPYEIIPKNERSIVGILLYLILLCSCFLILLWGLSYLFPNQLKGFNFLRV